MPLFSVTDRLDGLTINAALWEIVVAQTHKPKLIELQVTAESAVAATFGLGRPAVAGSGAAVIRRAVDEDTGVDSSLTTFRRAWTTLPTSPTTFIRRAAFAAAAGNAVLWVFPRGYGIPANGSLVLWNTSVTTVPDCTVWAVVAE